MRTIFIGANLVLLALLTGCQSMSESQCRVADWGRVGFADGAAGVYESRFANYTEDCGKIGVRPNAQAYRQGWDSGILKFCTAANGWRQGVEGNSGKEAVCVGKPGYAAFSFNLQAGLRVYRINQRISHNDAEIQRLQKQIEKAEDDKTRKAIRAELHDIDREQFRLRLELSQQHMPAP